MSDKHFVIINHGLGKQSLWPSTEYAEKYDKEEAENIATLHNSKKNMFNANSHGFAHVKPENQAHEYVSGNAYYKVKNMTEQYKDSPKDLIKSIIEVITLDESKKLNKDNVVHHTPDSEKFAKEYVRANKADYTSVSPTAKDEANSEKFHNQYTIASKRSGFGGSGTTHYTHKTTGEVYEVDRTPNGKGFHGTDHHISKIK